MPVWKYSRMITEIQRIIFFLKFRVVQNSKLIIQYSWFFSPVLSVSCFKRNWTNPLRWLVINHQSKEGAYVLAQRELDKSTLKIITPSSWLFEESFLRHGRNQHQALARVAGRPFRHIPPGLRVETSIGYPWQFAPPPIALWLTRHLRLFGSGAREFFLNWVGHFSSGGVGQYFSVDNSDH